MIVRGRLIEWPAGSGIVARYAPYEARFIRELIEAGQAKGRDPDEVNAEVEFLHGLKATFDAEMVP